MPSILIVYGSRHGHTAAIARRMAAELEEHGHTVTLRHLRRRDRDLPITGADAVLVGASVHFGTYQRTVRQFVRAHVRDLAARPTGFFSVSLTSAGDGTDSGRLVDEYVARFKDETGWQPGRVVRLAGALLYTRYNPILRRLLRRIAREQIGPGYDDMSRDYDFTDYDTAEAFARTVADEVLHTSA